MMKALLKKQMLEAFSWLYFDRKKGSQRNKSGILLYTALYCVLFGILGVVFYQMANALGGSLCGIGFGWLYFSMVSLVAVVLGVFGSIFNTYASLYQAKDNDLLLSMPIPAHKILTMRLTGVYAMGLLYELIVMIPAIIVWFRLSRVTVLSVVFSLLICLVLSVFVLTLSCILGWVVALVSSRVKNKSFVTVLLSLGFIAGYYYVYFKAYDILMHLVANAENIAGQIKSVVFPVYHLGLAAEGNPLSMLIFTATVALFFAVVYFVLSRSFTRLATTNRGEKKKAAGPVRIQAGNVDKALLQKEFKRFTGSANYMMNCGLGVLFMLLAAVMLIIKAKAVRELVTAFGEGAGEVIPPLLTAALCMILSMNDMTAPSISLEGKSLWILHSLPVSPWRVLKAKLRMHLILTVPVALLLTAVAVAIINPPAAFWVVMPVTVGLFVLFTALFGLFLNLKAPNLNWTNEIVPIKQSMSVTVALFGGWGIVIVLSGAYLLLMQWLSPVVYLGVVGVLLLSADIGLFFWLKRKGTKIFSSLLG